MRDPAELFAKQFLPSRGAPLSVARVLRTRQFERFSVTAFAVHGPEAMRLGAGGYDLDGRLADGGFLSSTSVRGTAWGSWASIDDSTIVVALDPSGHASSLRLRDDPGHHVEDTPVNGVAILRIGPAELDMTSTVAQWLDPQGAVLDSFIPLAGRRAQTSVHGDGP